MIQPQIFIVEDEGIIAAAIQSRIESLGYATAGIASSAEEALARIAEHPPDLVLMDIQLAGLMDGVEAADQIRRRFALPVIFLTAHAEASTVERARVTEPFGYIVKPINESELHCNIEMALYRHRMERERSDVLENTVGGCIRVLTEILSMVEPRSFGHGQRLKDYMAGLADALKVGPAWELEGAAMLAQIGFVTIPPGIVQKFNAGLRLEPLEREMIDRVPEFGANLLSRIPRLDNLARIVRYQRKDFDGGGVPTDEVAGGGIPLGARMLRIVADILDFAARDLPNPAIIERMFQVPGRYDPELLRQAIVTILSSAPKGAKRVPLKDLRVGQMLKDPIHSNDGTALVAAGNRISALLLDRLNNFTEFGGIREPIQIEE